MYASMTSDQRNLLWVAMAVAIFVLAGVLFGFNGVAGLLLVLIAGFSVVAFLDEHQPGTPLFRHLTPDAQMVIGCWGAIVLLTVGAVLFGLAGVVGVVALAVAWLAVETQRPAQ